MDRPTYESWSGLVNFRVYVLSSGPSALWNFIRYRDDFNPEGIDAWDTECSAVFLRSYTGTSHRPRRGRTWRDWKGSGQAH